MSEIRKYVARSIRLKDKYFGSVQQELKKSTIRYGFVLFNDIYIDLLFESNPSQKVRILKIDYSKTFQDISGEDAISDGYNSLEQLKSDIKFYYPDIQDASPITIIYFKLLTTL